MNQIRDGFRAVNHNTSNQIKKELLEELLKINVDVITTEEDSAYFIDLVTAQLQFPQNKTLDMQNSLKALLWLLQDKEMKILNKEQI